MGGHRKGGATYAREAVHTPGQSGVRFSLAEATRHIPQAEADQ